MRPNLNKFVEGSRVTGHVAKLFAKDVYEKVMVKSLIMSGTTGQGHWIVYQLVWLVGQRTGVGNLLLNAGVQLGGR